MPIDRVPPEFRSDVARAVEILRSNGADEVYLFGSIREACDPEAVHDIDIAVAGLPPQRFFAAYGTLMMTLDNRFDLVDLANDSAFVETLKESGTLERVG